jgi:WD40 repeat protein
MKTCTCEQRTFHCGPVAAVAISGDTVITGGYDGRVGWWKHGAGGLTPERFVYLHEKGINCVAISPDGTLVASGGSDGVARIVRGGESSVDVVTCLHPGDVESLVFTSDSGNLLTGGTDGTARLFAVDTGREVFCARHGKTVGGLCRHPNPDLLITGCNDRKLRLLRASDGSIVAEALSHTGPVKTVGVVESGIVSSGHDQSLLLHDLDLSALGVIARFSTTPKTIAVEPGGRHFWTGVYDQRTSRWGCGVRASEFRREVSRFSSRAWAHGLAAGPGFAVVGSFDGSPILLTVEPGGAIRELHSPAPVGCISTSALSPGAGIVIAGDSGRIRFAPQLPDTNAIADNVASEIAAVPGAITSIAGDPDDLVVASWDGEVARLCGGAVVWKARWDEAGGSGTPILRIAREHGRVLAGLYTGGCACFHEDDGSLLWANAEATGAVKCTGLSGDIFAITGRYDPLRVGDARTGEIKACLFLNTPVSDALAFSPFASQERPRMAVAAGDNEVWIVDVVLGDAGWEIELVHRSPGHTLPIKALAWTADDTVYAGDYAGVILRHGIGSPSSLFRRVDCKSGISSLAFRPHGTLIWTTFDGHLGSGPMCDFYISATHGNP